MHENSLLAFRTHAASFISATDHVLEIGADGAPSTFCREAGNPERWDTADLAAEAGLWSGDQSRATILMSSEYEVPVADNTYDVVFSAQVVEHVREMWTWMKELGRITKPGGRVITISPISWPYHEAPIDCWRIYPAGMEAVCGWAGLSIEHSWWGSLEQPPSRRTYPGASSGGAFDRPPSMATRLRRAVGWPHPVAHDLVTVARKPGS